ncbi:MAG: FAD binding domain-containing protein [Anaerolineales bacterium]|nr:FAD binding domain-containing protein [Anaerolineales bacterium]
MLARPGLPEFEYHQAHSPQEVFDLMAEKGDGLKIMMGGTDLFVQMRDRSEGPGALLDLKGLPGMKEISFKEKEGLQIGAAASLNSLSSHPDLLTHYKILCQAADTVGNYQLRNRATLGGNICNASPSADMAPALLVYEGKVVLESPRGVRVMALNEFWIGPGKTALVPDEYLKAIHFPLPPDGAVGRYLKLGRSKMGDLAVVGVAVLGYPDPDVPAGASFRIGINSTAPTAYRIPAVEAILAKNPISDEALYKAAESAMDISAPIEDQRATAEYQKKMVRNLVYKGLKEIWETLK